MLAAHLPQLQFLLSLLLLLLLLFACCFCTAAVTAAIAVMCGTWSLFLLCLLNAACKGAISGLLLCHVIASLQVACWQVACLQVVIRLVFAVMIDCCYQCFCAVLPSIVLVQLIEMQSILHLQ